MKKTFIIFVLFSISLALYALPAKGNSRDSVFLKESISYILANISQDHPERFDTICSIILNQHKDIKSAFGESSLEYNTLIQAADFIYTLSRIFDFNPLQKYKELGKWIRKLERYYDKSATSQLSIATALSDYYNTNKKGKKAKYWIDIQKKLSIQNNNFVQLGNAYVTEATVAVAEKDKKLLYNVINDIINEKRIPQQAVTIAFNTCLVFGYNYLDEKELEILYGTIAQNDSLNLQELLNAADKAAEHNDTTGVKIILGSQSVQSLAPDEYIHLFHEVSSFFQENNPHKAIELLNEAIQYGQNHNRNDLLFEEWDKTYHYYRTIALYYISQLNDRSSYIEYELKNLKEIESYYGRKSSEYCKTTTDIANIMSLYGYSTDLTMLYDSISVRSHIDFYGDNSVEYIKSVLNQMGHAKQYHKYDYFWNGAKSIENIINNYCDSIQRDYFNLLGQVCSMQGESGRAILMYDNALQKCITYQERCAIVSNLALLHINEGNDSIVRITINKMIEDKEFNELSGDKKFLLLETYASCLETKEERYAVLKKSEKFINDSGISVYNKVQHYLKKSNNSPTRNSKLEALNEAKTQCFQEQPRDSALYVQVLAKLGEEYNSYWNTNKSIECYEEIYEILKSYEVFDSVYQINITEHILSKLTGLYAASGNISKSQEYAESWFDLVVKACEQGHPSSSSWLYGVSIYLPIEKSTELYEKYDDILKQQPFYLWGKAYLYERKGLFNEATALYEDCLKDTSLVASTLPRLLRMYNKIGLNHRISKIEDNLVYSQNNVLLSRLTELTESEQKNMIPLIEGSVVQVLRGMPNLHSSYSIFDHMLLCKGLLYNINFSKRMLLAKKKNKSLRDSLRIIKEEIASISVKNDSVTQQSLQVKKDSLERLLASHDNFENILKNDLQKNSSSLKLQKVINEDELIIDLEKFNEDGNVYYKSIVMANDIPPTIIDLYKDANDTIFYNQLEPYIKRYKKVYFSPSGSSLVYPLEYILRKKYKNIEFHRVFSLSNIHTDRRIKDFNIVAFGNPSFNTDLAQTKSKRSDLWQPLPGSKVEIDSITSYIRNFTTGRALQFTEHLATENKLKSIEKKDISILHISTHGFYNALTNESGLLFTGANRGVNGESNDDTDDGILTCEEIENLYFPNLKLVVLSACETGLGETNIDGVWGLQRAFRIAGAQNMIVSLKKVDDDLTQAFMINFYKNLTSGKSIYDSFWEAMDNADEDTRNSFILIE